MGGIGLSLAWAGNLLRAGGDYLVWDSSYLPYYDDNLIGCWRIGDGIRLNNKKMGDKTTPVEVQVLRVFFG